ncbi:carbamoyltransferase N-terminal domain-containing protein [Fibrella aquatilis]|uniref:Nodulation protein NodU n=1 Tax=Fibrella aquatilis TaxID=2817059 RepID=A0A939GBX9_9BACT|nr:carbamoyltransferase N-terminal domain-containing protein [Fibrella aquatilis]MBO0933573.1 nodulation protein NodU [Fibrella aquatilis]
MTACWLFAGLFLPTDDVKICGLKLTHDGSVAVIEDGTLLFSIELEKLSNHPRYQDIGDTRWIETILEAQGCPLASIDQFAIDGWGGNDQEALAIQPRLTIGEEHNYLTISNYGSPYQLAVAQYQERSRHQHVLEPLACQGLAIGDQTFSYTSYLHVAGHISSAYCTSPFAQRGESSFVLVWDGGMYPQLYFFDAETRQVDNLGPIFLLIGNVYTIFSQHFGPFKVSGSFAKDDLSIAGKVMAYIALGQERRELFAHFDQLYNNHYSHPMGFANSLANEFKQRIEGQAYTDEDILLTFHLYLEEMLVSKLAKKIARSGRQAANLCLVGGCALNIKWNSAIRQSGLFGAVYVPPFPNDSGSAVGVACAAMLRHSQTTALHWNVYSGPAIIENAPAPGWTARPCSVAELASLLHVSNEPVVLLNACAELGPRALGNRSIVGNATNPNMKAILNAVKKRESYRPVSPICLCDKAPALFDPGTPDPFMLFDHQVRPHWLDRIPAVCHLDQSARLQTITREDNPLVGELLEAYEALSGIPLLCNTSANLNGSGFFPDVYSATAWNQVNYVWCNQVLYEKADKIQF